MLSNISLLLRKEDTGKGEQTHAAAPASKHRRFQNHVCLRMTVLAEEEYASLICSPLSVLLSVVAAGAWTEHSQDSVLVVGAGIAGLAVAAALHKVCVQG